MNDRGNAEFSERTSGVIDRLIRRRLRVGDPTNPDEVAAALREVYPDEDEAYVLLHYDLRKLCLEKVLASPSISRITKTLG
jgi:hypothetical protein